MEAFELLEVFCELLLARFGLIETMPMCDSVIKEAVASLIYASPRCDLKELHQVRELLSLKYGKEFTSSAINNLELYVNEKIVQKLKIDTPSPTLVSQYLIEIARAYQVPWTCEIPEPIKVLNGEKITQATSSSDLPDIASPLETSPPYIGYSPTCPTAPYLPADMYQTSPFEKVLNHSQPLSFGTATLVNSSESESKGYKHIIDSNEKWTSPELEELSRRFDALKKD
ncbi:hypothetical protein HMI55_003929 [Coelomomyces lativittatus]|nr:hypothetical protein HMI55_003929 [Coelomomyces lativittatus]